MTAYDIAICGAGPIGAATAYALRTNPDLSIAVISREPADDPHHLASYRWAGGSVRLFWEDAWKQAAVDETTALARQFVAEGVDLNVVENNYVFVNHGRLSPGLNLAGAKFIAELLRRAEAEGVRRIDGATIDAVTATGDSYTIATDRGEIHARKVLLALGSSNARVAPTFDLKTEKRQVFVLDLPVDGERSRLPHLVLPFEHGVVFAFVKNINGVLRIVVGQEEVIEHGDDPGPEDYFADLLERGLADRLPWLAKAKVLDTLWGFDVTSKTLAVTTPDDRLFVANCGSAVRSSGLIGRELAERLTAAPAAKKRKPSRARR
jgi:glycine/D-amino acid oxidase-like deaminating enzyme